MKKTYNRPFLYVIPGEKDMQGPATRLGLYERFPAPSFRKWGLVIFTKGLLLWAVLHVALSRK